MSWRLICFLGSVIVLSFAGCQSRNAAKAVEVTIEGGGEFPEFLVGRWKSDKKDWEMVFEEDGSISEGKHSIGGTLIKPKHLTTVELDTGKNIYKAGFWTVYYDPNIRELTVEIVIDYIHLEWGPVVLEGTVKDTFSGKVSIDGENWQADWFSFPEYKMPGDETKKIAPNVDELFVDVLTFTKVEE